MGGLHGIGRRAASLFLPFRWDFVGFSLSRAWTPALLSFTAGNMWQGDFSTWLQAIIYLSSTLAALIAAVFARATSKQGATASAATVIAGVGVLGVVLVIVGASASSILMPTIGLALAGFCAGYYETLWGSRFVELNEPQLQSYTLAMIALAAAFGVVLGFLPSPLFYAALCLLPVGAAGFYLLTGTRENGIAPASTPRDARSTSLQKTGTLWCILACVLIFSMLYNLVVELAYDYLQADIASQVRFTANMATALGLLALSLILSPLKSVALFRLILPITAVGFVLYLLAPQSLGIAALTVSSVGRKLFDILTWVLVARAIQTSALNSISSFGLLVAGKDMGYLFGLLGATAVLRHGPGMVQVAAVVPVVLLVLIVCFFWLFPEGLIDRIFGTARPTDPHTIPNGLDAKIAAVASSHRLTPRETEVLSLLARGRTQSVVAEKLGISEGTTHTHIIHVYKKLGVNKQQELIELVETSEPQTAKPHPNQD